MAKRVIPFGVIGCGLMGREFASASARWMHLTDPKTLKTLPFEPHIVGVCDTNPALMAWFADNFDSVRIVTTNYHDLLNDPYIEAIYCAVPHNLHAQIFIDIINAGKHLLGEKPFGIDLDANQAINTAIAAHPDVLVRCSSEFPFFPAPYQIGKWIAEGRFGQIIEVEAGLWHSSDLDPNKPINWKRIVEFNGEYGCMGDLGMHAVHLPFRAGWNPVNVRALLSNIVTTRPGPDGASVPAETWDNAILATEAESPDGQRFPMVLSTKRIAPGDANTWFIRILGTEFSAEYSTKDYKRIKMLPYASGGPQAWHVEDVGYSHTAYPGITGHIFEFGFPDGILQMWAAFCDELTNGREGMMQPFICATPAEAERSHHLFTAALDSQRTGQTIEVNQTLTTPI